MVFNFNQSVPVFPKAVFQETIALSPNCQFQLPEDSPDTRLRKWARHMADDIDGQLKKLDTVVMKLEEKEGEKKEENAVIQQALALTECARPLSPRCLKRLCSQEAMDKNADEDSKGKTAPGFAMDASPNINEEPAPAASIEIEKAQPIEVEVEDALMTGTSFEKAQPIEVEDALMTPEAAAPAPAPRMEIEKPQPIEVEDGLMTSDQKKESLKSTEANHVVPRPEQDLQSKPARGKRTPLVDQDASKAKKNDKGDKEEIQVEPGAKEKPTSEVKPASKRAQKTPPAAKAKTKANAKGKAKTTKKRDTARGAGAKKVEKAQPKKSPGKKKNIPETKEADREEGKQQAEPEDLLKKKLHSVPWHLEHFFYISFILMSSCFSLWN